MAICEIINALIAKIVCCKSVQNCCQDERITVKTDSPNNSEDGARARAIITDKPKDSDEVQELHNESKIRQKQPFKSAATALMAKSTATNSSESREIDSPNNNEDTIISVYNESKETLVTIVVKTKSGIEFKTPQNEVQDSNNNSEISTRYEQSFKSAANAIPMTKSTATSSESRDSNSRYQTANDESTSLQELPKTLNKNSRLTSTKIKTLENSKKKFFKFNKIFQFFKKKM